MQMVIIGNCTIDYLLHMNKFPLEDTKNRLMNVIVQRGGNGANVAVVLSQLGDYKLYFMGVLGAKDNGVALKEFRKCQVNVEHCTMISDAPMPTSYIVNAGDTRTILHHRSVREYQLDDFKLARKALKCDADWWHFECRNAALTVEMIRHVKNKFQISVEVESIKHDWKEVQLLIPHVGVLFVSKEYVQHLGYETAFSWFNALLDSQIWKWNLKRAIIVPWGQLGAFAVSNELIHAPVKNVDCIVDSNGAGDTFIAGVLHGIHLGLSWQEALAIGNKLGRAKCMQHGFQFQCSKL